MKTCVFRAENSEEKNETKHRVTTFRWYANNAIITYDIELRALVALVLKVHRLKVFREGFSIHI